MNIQPEQLDRGPDPLDRLLAEARWPEARPEVIQRLREQWQSLMANRETINALARRRKATIRTIIFAVAAAVLVCVWLGVSHLTTDGPNISAFAQVLDLVENAKTITWKTTYYSHMTSKDGKRTWIRTEKHEQAYKAPGLYRDTFFDGQGHVWSVEIKDVVHRRKLVMFPGTNKATLSESLAWFGAPSGPFDWVKKELEDASLQWVETRKTASGEVNVFRHAYRDSWVGRDWSHDFWIDQKTKRLVEVRDPGADIYDPDKDPARGNPPGKEYSDLRGPLGCVWHDIVFDAHVDDSLFRLEPSEGYTVKTEPLSHVTEKEMIDYLGILADFNGKMFPDEPDIRAERVNKAWGKPQKDRTPAEQKLVETVDYYTGKFQRMPNTVFIQEYATEKSFRYLGKGVKLGDKHRIVCWYKLKGAKTYRVVYGDLSVKDVAAEKLPLPVPK